MRVVVEKERITLNFNCSFHLLRDSRKVLKFYADLSIEFRGDMRVRYAAGLQIAKVSG